MAIILFFGMSLLIFIAGLTVITISFYHWAQVAKEKKRIQTQLKNQTLAPGESL